jgi:hypothetical protein
LVSEIQVATTNVGTSAQGGLTSDFLALSSDTVGARSGVFRGYFNRGVCVALFACRATVARLHRLRPAAAGPNHKLFVRSG